jgi:hypothetical protein
MLQCSPQYPRKHNKIMDSAFLIPVRCSPRTLESLHVREETQPTKICIVCKRPITAEQRPSVQLANGDEIHVECWEAYDKARPKG